MKRVIAAAALLLSVAACGDGHKATLEHTQWKLVQADGIPAAAIDREADFFTMAFDATTQTVNGMTNCNRFFGRYKVSGRQIDFDNMGMTRMACPDAQYEHLFAEMLDDADRFEVRGKELRLYDDKRLIATFKAVGAATKDHGAASSAMSTHADSTSVAPGANDRREMRHEERVEKRDERRDSRDSRRDGGR